MDFGIPPLHNHNPSSSKIVQSTSHAGVYTTAAKNIKRLNTKIRRCAHTPEHQNYNRIFQGLDRMVEDYECDNIMKT